MAKIKFKKGESKEEFMRKNNLKSARKLGFIGKFVKGAAKGATAGPLKFVDKVIDKQKKRDEMIREKNRKLKERGDKKFRKR